MTPTQPNFDEIEFLKQQLQECNDKFHALTDQPLLGVIIVHNKEIKFLNNAVIHLFGFDTKIKSELTLFNFRNSIIEEDLELFDSVFLKPSILKDLIIRIHFPENKIKWAYISSKFMVYNKDRSLLSVFLDITPQKDNEIALLESETNLLGVIENTPDLIWSVDCNFIVKYINSSATAFLFTIYKKEFKSGISFLENLPSEIRNIWTGRFTQALKGQSFILVEDFLQNDQTFHYEISINPVIQKGNITRVSVIARDITDYRNLLMQFKNTNVNRAIQLNDTVRKLEDEIKERKKIEKNLIEAKIIAESANKAKTEFLANMSHELRTPLNAIIGFSEIMLDEAIKNQDNDHIEFLNLIYESGNHLLTLINQILDLSKIESGVIELVLKEFSINNLILTTIDFFKERALKKNIQLECDLKNEIKVIYADETRIKQILFNLLSNAIKFTPDNGKIGLKVEIFESTFQFTIWDTGIGISEENIKKLFQPFQQIENPFSKKYAGTGLGLHMCRKLVELHKGKIWVESKEHQGSKFIFTIPQNNQIQYGKILVRKILFVGLDGAGKTTIINHLLENPLADTYIPSEKINRFSISFLGIDYKFIDLPGKKNLRYMWESEYKNTDVLIYVLDISNKAKFEEAFQLINLLMNHIDLKNANILFLFHKFDKIGVNLQEVKAKFLFSAENRQIKYLNTSIEIFESLDKIKKILLSFKY